MSTSPRHVTRLVGCSARRVLDDPGRVSAAAGLLSLASARSGSSVSKAPVVWVGPGPLLRAARGAVIEVDRPNRQVRRRHGKSDVIDAIAAARAVVSDQATVIPKAHNGNVEALRALQVVHRSAIKSRTQALNQLHALILTAPEPIRGQLRDLTRADRLTVCAGYRPGDRDDLVTITKLALREPATRINDLTAQVRRIESRRARLVKATAPRLMKIYGVGPDTAAALLGPLVTTPNG